MLMMYVQTLGFLVRLVGGDECGDGESSWEYRDYGGAVRDRG
jgi:hypothetical protein